MIFRSLEESLKRSQRLSRVMELVGTTIEVEYPEVEAA
jgi:hypothetical protein